MPLACRVQWSWVDRTGDTVKQSQRRVTSPTVIEACLLTARSKMFRQHLKCSLTAPRRAGTSSGFFVSFYSASCLSLGDLVQRSLGQPVDLLAPWPSAALIPHRRSTAAHFQSVERRVQRNLEGLANVRLDELTVVRRHWLFFFNAYAEKERTRREGRQKSSLASKQLHPPRCMQKRDSVSVPLTSASLRKTERPFQAQSVSHRIQTRPVSSRSVNHGIFPGVYFYTQSLQRPHERCPMASRREQVSALFFVAWTQRRLIECFPWATEGPNPPKETLTFKKEFFGIFLANNLGITTRGP